MSSKLKKTILYLPLIILALIIIIFIGKVIYFSQIINKQDGQDTASLLNYLQKQTPQEIITSDSYSLGSSNPKITIVKFSDFACPYSKKLSSKMRDLVLKYPNDIKFVYKDFPVINEWSIPLSLAARCAGEQGVFWEMHDMLFEMQGAVSPDNVSTLAQSFNIDLDQFEECMQSEKYFPEIKRDAKEAEALGARNTPTTFINGNIISGDIPEDILNKLIEEMLQSNK